MVEQVAVTGELHNRLLSLSPKKKRKMKTLDLVAMTPLTPIEDALLVEIVPYDENGKDDHKHEKGWLGNKNCYE